MSNRCPGGTNSSSRPVIAPKSPADRPRPVIGSRRWASKPADTTSHVGAKPATSGASTVVDGQQVDVARGARRQREVQRRAETLAGAGLGEGAGARVERPLVERHVHHAPVAVEDVLRAVAVVGVVVDDEHALAPCRERGGRDGDVVHDAEAHGARAGGVVARRAHRTERRRPDPAVEGFDRRQPGPAAREAASHDAVEHVVSASMLPPAGGAEAGDGVEVGRGVDPFDLLARGGAARAPRGRRPLRRTGRRAAPPPGAPDARGGRGRSGDRGSARASRRRWTLRRGYRQCR